MVGGVVFALPMPPEAFAKNLLLCFLNLFGKSKCGSSVGAIVIELRKISVCLSNTLRCIQIWILLTQLFLALYNLLSILKYYPLYPFKKAGHNF